jgi:hypothetical protein
VSDAAELPNDEERTVGLKGEADNPKMEGFGVVLLDMAARAAELADTTTLGR